MVSTSMLINHSDATGCHRTTSLYLAQLAAQFNKFLAFSGAECPGLGGYYTTGNICQAHLTQNAGGVAAKLFDQLCWLLACTNQLDHLLTKLRWVRRFGMGI